MGQRGGSRRGCAGILAEALVISADGSEAVLHPAELAMAYRDSRLKHAERGRPEVVLSATFALQPADPEDIAGRLDEIRRWRQAHQPLGQRSAGSVFRNPEGDSAGRLIDAAGLKGLREGDAMVSPKHANFIVNVGSATAGDVRRLGDRVRDTVERAHGVRLAYEVEFVGRWPDRSTEEAGEPAAPADPVG